MIFNGDRLRKLREAKLWTRLAFAKRLGVSDPQIGRWEAGKAVPRMGTIKKISKVLGCPVSELAVEEMKEGVTV